MFLFYPIHIQIIVAHTIFDGLLDITEYYEFCEYYYEILFNN